mgnify:FL=1
MLDFTVKRMKNTDIIGNANRCWDIAQKYVIMKYGHDPAGMRMNGAACADMGRNAKQEETVMLAQQRYQKILDLLEEHGIVHSADLVQEMKVSSETVRKDLDALEQSGKLKQIDSRLY